MAAEHKYAKNGVDLNTALGLDQVAVLAMTIGNQVQGTGWNRSWVGQPVNAERLSPTLIAFVVRNLLRSVVIRWFLTLEQQQDRVIATVHIGQYTTSQTTVYFIPIGPKSMEYHSHYMEFVTVLTDQVLALDPTASAVIRAGARNEATTRRGPASSQSSLTATSARPAVLAAPLPPAVPVAPSRLVSPIAPTPPPPPPPPPATSLQSPASSTADPDHGTTVGRTADVLSLVLADGGRVSVDEVLVLGRDPSPPESHPMARAVAVADPRGSISKTHALIELRAGVLWLTDLRSMNGTIVTDAAGDETDLDPGIAVPIGRGYSALLGDYPIRFEVRS